MNSKKIVIGARGSQLSLIQTQIVIDLLKALIPETMIEVKTITTAGDKNMSPIPLDTIGKGWFTKEIDRQLLTGEIDIAVHSLKDLLDTLTPGLIIAALPKREDPSEALVSINNVPLKKLKKNAVIGTDSIRRKIQIENLRPDSIVKSVRGNVIRRLEKLDSGDYDGLLLAVAGLKRLGLTNRIAEQFNPTEFIPSPGQGTLAVVTRKTNTQLNALLSQLNDPLTVAAVTAERTFSAATGGGCSMPVGAYADVRNKTISLFGMIGSEDGMHHVTGEMTGSISDPAGLAKQLAKELLEKAKQWDTHQRTNQHLSNAKYVVLTREETENNIFAKKLQSVGLSVLSVPSISITAMNDTNELQQSLIHLKNYDWIIFTSTNGIRFFMKAIENNKSALTAFQTMHIAAVGKKTAETIEGFGFPVSVIPKTYTAAHLAEIIPYIRDKKILYPRSSIADPKLKEALEKKGAHVTDIPMYKTIPNNTSNQQLQDRIETDEILCLTFTSPSTIQGFLAGIGQNKMTKIFSLPVISIGPVTTDAAKHAGFKTVYTADFHTIEGMVLKIQETVL